jgi:hypothetical protein
MLRIYNWCSRFDVAVELAGEMSEWPWRLQTWSSESTEGEQEDKA